MTDDEIFGEDAIEKKIRRIRADAELFGGSSADIDAIERELRSTLQAYQAGMITRSDRNEKLGELLDSISETT